MKKIKTKLTGLCLLASAILSGCASNDDIYDTLGFTGTGEYNAPAMYPTALRGMYDFLSGWLVLIIVLSELAGIFLVVAFSKRNKKIKKFAVFGLMIMIPLFFIILFFGMAFELNKYY